MPGYNEAPNPVTMMGYDPTTHLFIPVQFQTVATDPFNQELYGQLVGGGGGGGGGAVTAIAGAFVDGAIVTIGAKNDTAWDGVAASASEIQILKKLVAQLAATLSVNVANANPNGQTTRSASAPVSWASDQTPIVCGTGTPSSVPAAITSTQLLAANGARKGMSLYNSSTAILYLSLFASGSATSYTTQVQPGTLYEMPSPIYTGIVSGEWSAANGNALITEMS